MPIRANKVYAAVLLLAVISLVVSACASVKTPVPKPVTATPTSTNAPALTETPAPAQTATALPVTATWTQQPSPTASPLPSLTPTPAPLSANGPWLVIAVDELDWQSATQFQVMNADGSGLQPLGLPAATENRAWLSLSEPRGPFLAFRTINTLGPLIDIQTDGVDDYVWILKLPENRVVRKLPLLSEAAWQVINNARASHPENFDKSYYLPTQLGLVINPYSFQWSPHGRYLTYSAALDGTGTDLYLYDTEKDTTRRLTVGRAGAQVWFWSPDGGTVLYTNGEQTSAAYVFPELTLPEGRYAVDIASGSERRLYQPSPSGETVIQALEQDFLVATSGFEGDFSNLRRINFKTGAIRTLFKDHFTAAASDGQTILLSLDPTDTFSSVKEGTTPGLYRLNPATGQPNLLREGHFPRMGYTTSLHLFHAKEDMGNMDRDTIQFDSSGVEKLRLPNTTWMKFSPDGQWVIAGMGGAWKFYNLSGEAQTPDAGDETSKNAWLNDSSGFYANSCVQGIQFYAQANAWQPVKVFPEGCTNFDLVQKP